MSQENAEHIEVKRCTKCNEEKTTDLFYSARGKPTARCKECVKIARREYVKNNHELVKSQKREAYWRDPEKRRSKTRKWRNENLEEARKYSREWSRKNKKRRKIVDIAWRYGISEEEYISVLKKQNGRCAICGASNSGKRGLHIDHCHKTGKFRGLLCGGCNTAIGQLKENVKILQKAIDYINEHNKI